MQEAKAEYTSIREAIMKKSPSERSPDERAFTTKKQEKEWVGQAIRRKSDMANQNFILFWRDAMLYLECDRAISDGGSERMQKVAELLTVYFHGCKKSKYAREMLELQVDRKVLWTPEARYIYKNNCLLSTTGRGMAAVDAVNEELNASVKVGYTPGGNMQSKEYQLKHIMRNLMVFKAAGESVERSSGAPNTGSRHTEVDAHCDITRLASVLIKENAMIQCKGRNQCGPSGSKVEIMRSIDSFDDGCTEIMTGSSLNAVIARRLKADQFEDVVAEAYGDYEARKGQGQPWTDEQEWNERLKGTLAPRQSEPTDERDWRIIW